MTTGARDYGSGRRTDSAGDKLDDAGPGGAMVRVRRRRIGRPADVDDADDEQLHQGKRTLQSFLPLTDDATRLHFEVDENGAEFKLNFQ